MKRKILIAAAGVVVVVVIVLIVVASNFGKIVKIGVEKGGTLVLGVPTTLNKATVSVWRGTAGVDGLTLGSPEGFAEPSMFELDHAHATVDIWSLRKDELIVKEVVIDGPRITLEFAGTKTNWGTVMERLQKEPAQEEAKQKSQRKVRVGRIVLSNAKVRIAGIPVAGSATVPLPRLEITDLAPADGTPSTIGNVLAQAVHSLYGAILAAAKDVLPAEQIKKLGADAWSAAGEAGATVKETGAAVGEAAAGAAKDAAEKAKGMFRSVLPGSKEKE